MWAAWRERQWLVTRAVVAMTAALLLTACGSARPSVGGGASSPGQASTGRRAVTLKDISVLRGLFNRDLGHARLVLIFSPT